MGAGVRDEGVGDARARARGSTRRRGPAGAATRRAAPRSSAGTQPGSPRWPSASTAAARTSSCGSSRQASSGRSAPSARTRPRARAASACRHQACAPSSFIQRSIRPRRDRRGARRVDRRSRRHPQRLDQQRADVRQVPRRRRLQPGDRGLEIGRPRRREHGVDVRLVERRAARSSRCSRQLATRVADQHVGEEHAEGDEARLEEDDQVVAKQVRQQEHRPRPDQKCWTMSSVTRVSWRSPLRHWCSTPSPSDVSERRSMRTPPATVSARNRPSRSTDRISKLSLPRA